MIGLFLGGAVLVLTLPFLRRKKRSSSPLILSSGAEDSRSESMADIFAEAGAPVAGDPRAWERLAGARGGGARWGGGSSATPWADGSAGVDCGGWLQMALERLGVRPSTWPVDQGVIDIANRCDPVAIGYQRVGDVAVYKGRHGMLVVSEPREDRGGHSHVMGASGGDDEIQGYDPLLPGFSEDARVKLFATALYRRDFLTYGRPRA